MSITELQDIALELNTAVTRLGRRIRRIDDQQDIGRARLSALSVLVFGGPRSMSDLAKEEMVSTATIHHVVKGLEDLKLASRSVDSADARRYLISATAKGVSFMEDAREARLVFYRHKLSGLSPVERDAIAQFAKIALQWLD